MRIQIGPLLVDRPPYHNKREITLDSQEEIKYHVIAKKVSKKFLKEKIGEIKKTSEYLMKVGSTSWGFENGIFKETRLGYYLIEVDDNKTTFYYTSDYMFDLMQVSKAIENVALIYLIRENIVPIHATAVYDQDKQKVYAFTAWMETGKTTTAKTLYKTRENILYFGEDRVYVSKDKVYPFPVSLYTRRFPYPDFIDLAKNKMPYVLRIRLDKFLLKEYMPNYFMKSVDPYNLETFFLIRDKKLERVERISGKVLSERFYLSIRHEIDPLYHTHVRQLLYANPTIFKISLKNLAKKYYDLVTKFISSREVYLIRGDIGYIISSIIKIIDGV